MAMMYIIGENIEAKVNGTWHKATIIDITGFDARVVVIVYVFDLKARLSVSNSAIREAK